MIIILITIVIKDRILKHPILELPNGNRSDPSNLRGDNINYLLNERTDKLLTYLLNY